jgi:glycosyltransferase involved in cell wall biosynthesis
MAQDKPLLSVLMAAYNAEKYVGAALRSLLLQTYPNIEILVCDDCSTDATASCIEQIRDPRIRFFKNTTNKGKNVTCSDLLEQANGTYISVHDADDISLPERFVTQMEFLITHPEFAMCGTNFISFLDNGLIIGKSSLETNPMQIREKIKKSSQFHGPTIVFKKDILKQIGGFYRYFTRAEDIDLTMRMLEKFQATNLPQHLYLYRHVNTSLTNNLSGYNIERLGHAKLLYYLADERMKNNGIDSLMRGDYQKIDRLMVEFVEEYKADPDIAYRKGVFRLLDMCMHRNAVNLAWRTFRKNQTMLNFKCLIYAVGQAVRGEWTLLRNKEKVDLQFLK